MGTYINDQTLKKPNDDDTIWRYMDFTKFVNILHFKSLHFTPVDELKDPYEGSLLSYLVETGQKGVHGSLRTMFNQLQPLRKKYFVNCWHINASESAALWRVYMKSDEGIAIQSTVRKLVTVLEASKKNLRFDLASIEYDPRQMVDVTTTPDGNNQPIYATYKAILIKRPCFAYEKELRAFVRLNKHKSGGFDWPGLDINSLIESVYVNPEAPEWIVSLVEHLAKSYGITGKVCKSNIY